MKNLLFISFTTIFVFTGCVSNKNKLITKQLNCPANSPSFSKELGTKLINRWTNNLAFFSPNGAGGFVNPNVGAAYLVGSQYLPNAVLMTSQNPVTRNGSQEIYEYFAHFMENCPQITNNPSSPEDGGPFLTSSGCGNGVISGYYNFVYTCGPNKGMIANARYTFQFQYLNTPHSVSIKVLGGNQLSKNQAVGRWYIMLQNSSLLPAKN